MYDLHAHISGSADAISLFNIIYQNGLYVTNRGEINSLTEPFGIKLADAIIDSPISAKESFSRVYPCIPNGRNRFNETMQRFTLTSYLQKLPGIKSQIGELVCITFKQQGVNYVEWRVDPFSSTQNETAEEGLEKLSEYYSGMRKTSLDSRFVLSVSKSHYRNDGGINYRKIEFLTEQIERLLKLGKSLPIVGIDAANAENISMSVLKDMFTLAQSYSLGVVPHVGECTTPTLEEGLEDIETALRLGSKRLGHAIATYMPINTYLGRRDLNGEFYDKARIERLQARQKEVLQQIKDANVAVEVCPTSNLSAHLGMNTYQEHPVDRLIEMDIPLVICTDDFGIFGRSLKEEINGLSEAKGLDKSQLIRNAENFSLRI